MLPPFLLLEDSDTDVLSLTALLKRIGLVNAVRVVGSVADAQRYLGECPIARLPVVAFIGAQIRGAHGLDLLEWMRQQPSAIGDIAAIALVEPADSDVADRVSALKVTAVEKPVDMRALITAMKGLGLPERAKIDVATLTVQVELWPRGTLLDS